MEHLLDQTKVLNKTKAKLKTLSKFSIIFSLVMILYHSGGWILSSVKSEVLYINSQMEQSSQSTTSRKHHGPNVQSSNTEETFEALQKVEDFYNEETPYDDFIDK